MLKKSKEYNNIDIYTIKKNKSTKNNIISDEEFMNRTNNIDLNKDETKNEVVIIEKKKKINKSIKNNEDEKIINLNNDKYYTQEITNKIKIRETFKSNNKKSKGSNCSIEGKKYEHIVYNVVNKCYFDNDKLFNTQNII